MLLGLTGFAISQPLLSILGDAPTELAFFGLDGTDLVRLACLIAFVPPLVLWGITRLAALIPGRPDHRLDRWLHLAMVGGLVGLVAIQVAKSAGVEQRAVLAALALAAGAGFAVVYVRSSVVATWASYTAVLPVLAVASFLVVSPASALLDSAEAPERISGDHPSVVLIILDELPTRSLLDGDDGIDVERFPNLAAFADDATWYRHSSSLATLTEAAVPSMLTGNLPVAEEAVWTNHPDNLFTILAPTHELEVIEQATELCPYDVCVPTAAVGQGGGELERRGARVRRRARCGPRPLVRPRVPRRGRAARPRRLRRGRRADRLVVHHHHGGPDEPLGHRPRRAGGSADARRGAGAHLGAHRRR